MLLLEYSLQNVLFRSVLNSIVYAKEKQQTNDDIPTI